MQKIVLFRSKCIEYHLQPFVFNTIFHHEIDLINITEPQNSLMIRKMEKYLTAQKPWAFQNQCTK